MIKITLSNINKEMIKSVKNGFDGKVSYSKDSVKPVKVYVDAVHRYDDGAIYYQLYTEYKVLLTSFICKPDDIISEVAVWCSQNCIGSFVEGVDFE